MSNPEEQIKLVSNFLKYNTIKKTSREYIGGYNWREIVLFKESDCSEIQSTKKY